MLKLPKFTKSTLLASFFLLITGCNDTSKTDTETIESPTSLTITISKTTLNKDENTTVKVMASYKGGATKEVTDRVEWIVTPTDAVIVTEKILIAKKDTSTTLNAKLGTTLSNTVNLNIAWIINGHTLPPEPDKTVNDSTLLGVDVNGNGVRDDVERAIYKKFSKEVRRQLLMQKARAHHVMLSDHDAIDNAEKWQKIIANKPIACGSYLFRNFDIEFDIEATEYMEDKLYNNKDRLRKYMEYNHALGGGVYGVEESERVESACEFNVTKALGDNL